MGKSMFAPDVVGTDAFLDLREDAQLLYFRLGFEGTYGKIIGVKRIARGYGSDPAALQSLYDAGYLFDHNGACWVRHFWCNNSFKKPNHNYAMTMLEIVSGEIGFEGEPFKSAFVCPEVEKPYTSLTQGSTGTDSGTDSLTGADPSPDPSSLADASAAAGEGACGEGEEGAADERPCLCRRCGSAHATYTTANRSTTIHCPNCGSYPYDTGADSS